MLILNQFADTFPYLINYKSIQDATWFEVYIYWFINIDHALWNYELILEWIGFSGVTGSIKALFIKYYLTHSSMSKIHKD